MSNTTSSIVVLGGGSTIGRFIVQKFLADPRYDVIWTYYNSHIDQPGTAIKCDLRDMDQVVRLFERVGRMDILVTSSFPFIEGDNLDFETYLKVEPFLRAHVYANMTAAKKMEHGGKIFNMLGQCVKRGLPGGACYSGSFALLHNIANSINGREGKTGKVSICDFLLGPVDTREWDGLSPEIVQRYKTKVSQFISPQQVADMVAFWATQKVLPSEIVVDAYYGYGN